MTKTFISTITTLSMIVSLQTHAQDIRPPNNYSEMLDTNAALELKYKEACPLELVNINKGEGFKSCILKYVGNLPNDADFIASVNDYMFYSTLYDLEVARAREERDAEYESRLATEKAARDELAKKPGVRIGMTPDQVINETSWGRPEYINRTTTSSGIREQWVYDSRNYLYFDNGILVSIQN